ncbi:MAG: 16S rRNA (uracil(1498)-N(3))-methyltransferase [Firmicutes bacterium]|nr:16S rRNA (uracil(1498)-N(3))-methyltransferase [Bacillota bacterium]MBQ9604097.1 16S rRNA (uracil(1498)-N(3))-methyltransferase [Bacillota bacterium]
MPKYFTSPESINGDEITLDEETSLHLSRVLRCKAGDMITVGDGSDNDYECEITEITKNAVRAKIIDKHLNLNEPDIKITLYQGLPKGDKTELIIQKCVEIGVDRIVPVSTTRSVVKLDKKGGKKIERWNKISLSAAKQCGRGKIPEVSPVMTFKEAVEDSRKCDGRLIPYENEQKNGLKSFCENFKGKSIAVFIGPEGGFDTSEIELAKADGITPVTLGKRILRTETAGLVTAVILLHRLENEE